MEYGSFISSGKDVSWTVPAGSSPLPVVMTPSCWSQVATPLSMELSKSVEFSVLSKDAQLISRVQRLHLCSFQCNGWLFRSRFPSSSEFMCKVDFLFHSESLLLRLKAFYSKKIALTQSELKCERVCISYCF